MSLPDRLGVIRELMDSLDVVTRSGRDHVMQKVVRILRGEMLREELSLSGQELGAAMNAMTELEHEAGRVTPMPDLFSDNARVLVGLLAQASRPNEPPSPNEPIAAAPDGEQMFRVVGVGFELRPELCDEVVDGPTLPALGQAPHLADQLVAGEHQALAAAEKQQ